MPIYEYQCVACGKRHEILQKMGEVSLRDCPACGRAELVKLVSVVGFRLGGSGWYETDFKTGSKRNLAADAVDTGGGDKAGGSTDAGKGATRSDGVSGVGGSKSQTGSAGGD